MSEVTPVDYESMSHADRVAILKALIAALDERMKVEQAHIVENLLGATENTPIPTSGFGTITFHAPKRPVKIDDEKLLAYVKQVAPEAVTEEVTVTEVIDPELRERLIKDVVDVGDELFARGSTGEAIEYAYHGDETTPRLSWGASREQKVAKLNARKALEQHLPEITTPMIDRSAA